MLNTHPPSDSHSHRPPVQHRLCFQDAGRVTPVNRAIQFYISVTTACDSAFPFDPHDPFVVRVVDDAVVITPPTCDRETLDLPAIDAEVRTSIPAPSDDD